MPNGRPLQVVQRVLTRYLLDHACLKPDEDHGGAVTLIQPFGPAAKLHIHLCFYFMDRGLGLIHVRVQTGFSQQIQVYLNGQE